MTSPRIYIEHLHTMLKSLEAAREAVSNVLVAAGKPAIGKDGFKYWEPSDDPTLRNLLASIDNGLAYIDMLVDGEKEPPVIICRRPE